MSCTCTSAALFLITKRAGSVARWGLIRGQRTVSWDVHAGVDAVCSSCAMRWAVEIRHLAVTEAMHVCAAKAVQLLHVLIDVMLI